VAIARGMNVADFRLMLYALLLVTMMLARPQGLLGLRELWEVRLPWPRRAARAGA
jgi:ABC-type branched-subunit amino acid transport system permease subunit